MVGVGGANSDNARWVTRRNVGLRRLIHCEEAKTRFGTAFVLRVTRREASVLQARQRLPGYETHRYAQVPGVFPLQEKNMKLAKSLLKVAFMLTILVVIPACNTMHGAGKDETHVPGIPGACP
jgi:predicted small secreted protein